MSTRVSNDPEGDPRDPGYEENFHLLSLRLLQHANQGGSNKDFLRQCTKTLLDFTYCDVIGIYIADDPVNCYGEASRKSQVRYTFHAAKPGFEEWKRTSDGKSVVKPCFGRMVSRYDGKPSRYMTVKGSFWTGDADEVLAEIGSNDKSQQETQAGQRANYKSLALIPIAASGRIIGMLQMKCSRRNCFTVEEIEFYERVGDILGAAILSHKAQMALGERIKELSCLYRIAQIATHLEYSLDEILRNVVGILPPAWQYPEITEGMILIDGKTYATPGFTEKLQSQSAEIFIKGRIRGFIEVVYTEAMPELDEGPFLREERNLIDAISRLIAQIIERKQSEEDRIKLQNQLRHADRLATIGQLAAGVAHEFNEPLGNVLGFAQLILKNENIPEEIRRDINKIVSASMHAREVIRKLMLFARQMPAEKTKVNLNKVIEEGLYFLEARSAKAGIEMVRLLSPDVPEIMADQSQIHQVLVNLVVNAIQAMPDGGKIIISTECLDKMICLEVTDTGAGMSEEVQKQLFVPFFTTKDVDEGTGLGLPVVHGIVTSHGGSINVRSTLGKGSSFEIKLPINGPGNLEVSKK